MTDEQRIANAIALGWTHIYFASDPSTHPMAGGIRRPESGPRIGDEILVGTPPGKWFSRDGGITGSGPSEELPDEPQI